MDSHLNCFQFSSNKNKDAKKTFEYGSSSPCEIISMRQRIVTGGGWVKAELHFMLWQPLLNWPWEAGVLALLCAASLPSATAS